VKTTLSPLAATLLVGALSPAAIAGQSPAPAAPDRTFEVASVRLNRSGSGSMSMGWEPGGFRATNAPLLLIVQTAFGVRDRGLVGLPAWAASERYDITARAPGEIATDARQSMLQALLRERFALVTHREMREMPVYALVLARDDGRLGPGFRTSAVDCSPRGRAAMPPHVAASGGGAAGPGGGLPDRPVCGSLAIGSSLIAGGITASELASAVSRRVDRPVLDRTGLSGFYDVDLKWSPLTLAADDPGPTLFTAVQEQLGLRMERSQGLVEVLVIDRVGRPAPD
jgi:uncharacterized protein (TIGR03435 family)